VEGVGARGGADCGGRGKAVVGAGAGRGATAAGPRATWTGTGPGLAARLAGEVGDVGSEGRTEIFMAVESPASPIKFTLAS
jgi:hypothetical protein